MAHAAVTCLRTTILRILNSSRFSVVSSTRTSFESAHKELGSLRKVLEGLEAGGDGSNRHDSGLNALDGEVIDAVQKLEDSLELHERNQFLLQSESYGDAELMDTISSCINKVKEIKQEYKNKTYKSLLDEEEEEEGEDVADGNDPAWNMVGFSNQFKKIKPYLIGKRSYVFSIVGMAGIGKTALAERIFQDSFILNRFECRVFVRVGQKYKLEEMKRAILAQLNHPNYDMEEKDDERDLKEYLDEKRYLIVLDDVWDLGFWNDYFKHRRGDRGRGSRILLTTRVEGLALKLIGGSYFSMPLLNKVESCDLLCEKVFAEKKFPPQLQSAGKEIAERCDGLPLMVVTVAEILSKGEATLEFWNEAAHEQNSVFEDAYDRILEVVRPSYNSLHPQAKACFLYMGAFPPNHGLRRSKLVNLWCSEGFLEPKDSESVYSFASECFDKIVYDRVVVPAEQLSSDRQRYQACSLHSVFRHLCKKELEQNEFLHVIDRYGDGSKQGRQSKRRLSIQHNVLLSIKACRIAPTTRSLLFTGPYHQYQVPVNFNLRLLRVCDALTIRFYEFPMEALKLVQLAYFAITCNKNLPSSISKLWKLEYLIVLQHLSIINPTSPDSYMPVEIWDLQQLKHLQIVGRNLPNPPCDSSLPNLDTLLDVGIYSCSEDVLSSIPNLQKLRVQIQLTPTSAEPLIYLNKISQLEGLTSLRCVVVNPILLMSKVVVAPSLSISPSSITKLTLSGFGYPWENMNKFELPNLRVLKLLQYAFQGENWEVEVNGFLRLVFLSIEDTDLVQWKVGEGSFPLLSYLTLRSCYKLQELPNIASYQHIEVVDCNSAVLSCAQQKNCSVNSVRHSKNNISTIYTRVSCDREQNRLVQKDSYI